MLKTPDVEDQLEPSEIEASVKVREKFVEYGEYIYIELDSEEMTAKVIPV